MREFWKEYAVFCGAVILIGAIAIVLDRPKANAAAAGKASQMIVETSAGVFLYEPGGRNVWRWDGVAWRNTGAWALDR